MPENNGLMGQEIARSVAIVPNAVDTFACTTSSTSAAIDVGKSSFGSVHVVTTGAGSFTAFGAENKTAASFEAITDSTGTAVTITAAAAGWYELPSACFSVPYLQLRTNTSTATIRLYLKG